MRPAAHPPGAHPLPCRRALLRHVAPALLAWVLLGATALPAAALAADPDTPFDTAFRTFQLATQGDESQVVAAADQFSALMKARPGDPVTLAYAGAAEAMRATTTMLPWRKMQHAEDGLARLDKALALSQAPQHEAPGLRGIPVVLEVQFLAANTFLALPSFFNRRERGAKLLGDVLASPRLAQAPLPFQGGVWMRAAQQARSDGQTDNALRWLRQVVSAGAPQAPRAQAQLKELGA